MSNPGMDQCKRCAHENNCELPPCIGVCWGFKWKKGEER